LKPGRNRFDDRALRHHSYLDRADIEIGKDGVHLRGDEVRWHVVDGAHPPRVLRRQRADDRGAIDAERRECFEISLDAGAAARIRAGDGQRDWCRVLYLSACWPGIPCHPCPRCASASSTTPRSCRAAARGSSLSDSAEITATPSAPAAMTSPALRASIPAMPHSGSFEERRRNTPTMRLNPAGPIGGVGVSLPVRAQTPPHHA